MNDITSLRPLLVVRGAARAIDFYQRALGARLLARHEHGAERRISHADLALDGACFAVTEELRAYNSDAPESLGGSAVVLQLGVPDAAAALDSLCAAGASVVFPLQTFAGERMARVRDPFGHLWLVRQLLEPLAVEELQRRRDELFAQLTVPAPSPPAPSPPAPSPPSSSPTSSPATTSSTPGGAPVTGGLAALAPTSGSPTPADTKEAPSIESSPPPEQEPSVTSAQERSAARVHLLLGPVGAGKSTFARALVRERSALQLALDDWMTTLFSPDRPETGLPAWYVARAERCVDQIWKLVLQLTARGDEVVLELGLLRREERARFYARVEEAGLPLTVFVLDAAREVRRARVLERNRSRGPTFSMVVPPDIFELASDLWQAPESEECEQRDVRFLRTD